MLEVLIHIGVALVTGFAVSSILYMLTVAAKDLWRRIDKLARNRDWLWSFIHEKLPDLAITGVVWGFVLSAMTALGSILMFTVTQTEIYLPICLIACGVAITLLIIVKGID